MNFILDSTGSVSSTAVFQMASKRNANRTLSTDNCYPSTSRATFRSNISNFRRAVSACILRETIFEYRQQAKTGQRDKRTRETPKNLSISLVKRILEK